MRHPVEKVTISDALTLEVAHPASHFSALITSPRRGPQCTRIPMGLLQVPRARTTIGRRSFAVAGPSLWNSLPAALRRSEMTLHIFKRQLKACLFHI